MRRRVRFLLEAKAEFDEAADWYEARLRGLGKDFIAKVREVIKRITRTPGLYAMVHGEVRQTIIERFPYSALYQEDKQEIIVIAVFHSSRNPDVWKKRIRPT